MKTNLSEISGIVMIEPKVFKDCRGEFIEVFRQDYFEEHVKKRINFVQSNFSTSVKGTLRGLHYQVNPFSQGKLIQVSRGEIYDVAVDIRRSSPTFGNYVGEILSSENRKQMWIPPGFAHGFLVLSDVADVFYHTDQYYYPNYERCIIWNDSIIGIDWPELPDMILSTKDLIGLRFIKSELFA